MDILKRNVLQGRWDKDSNILREEIEKNIVYHIEVTSILFQIRLDCPIIQIYLICIKGNNCWLSQHKKER